MTEASSAESATESSSEDELAAAEDVERARIGGGMGVRSPLWLSLHDFQPGEEVRLLCLFSRLCSLTAIRQRTAGLELRFSSVAHLHRGRLLAKRLVAGRMQLAWHLGRLSENTPVNRSLSEGISVLRRLRRAFLNYFQPR